MKAESWRSRGQIEWIEVAANRRVCGMTGDAARSGLTFMATDVLRRPLFRSVTQPRGLCAWSVEILFAHVFSIWCLQRFDQAACIAVLLQPDAASCF